MVTCVRTISGMLPARFYLRQFAPDSSRSNNFASRKGRKTGRLGRKPAPTGAVFNTRPGITRSLRLYCTANFEEISNAHFGFHDFDDEYRPSSRASPGSDIWPAFRFPRAVSERTG